MQGRSTARDVKRSRRMSVVHVLPRRGPTTVTSTTTRATPTTSTSTTTTTECSGYESLVVGTRLALKASVHIVDKHLRKLESGRTVRVSVAHCTEEPAGIGDNRDRAEVQGPRHDHLLVTCGPSAREVHTSTPALLGHHVGLGSKASSHVCNRDGEGLAEMSQALCLVQARGKRSDRFDPLRAAAQNREEQTALPLRPAAKLDNAAHLLTHARARASEFANW